MINGQNILITGGAGFIGSHLVHKLLDSNQVTVYDIGVHPYSYLNEIKNHPNLTIHKVNLLNNVVNTNNFDYIIHAAGILGVQNIIDNPIASIEGNFLAVRNILNFSIAQKKLKKFLFFSTSEVYGNDCLNASEEYPHIIDGIGIRGNYACSKSLSEFLVKAYQQTYGLNWLCIRPFNIYGPFRYSSYAILAFIKNALLGKEIVINNNGNQIRTWCYISDFCDAVIQALELNIINEVFNIGNDKTKISVTNLAETIKYLSNSESIIRCRHDNLKEEIMFRSPNINKARKLLNYDPLIDLVTGLQNTIQWVKSII
ncbi:MAG: NAD-dependent epimerase/dehydratase family protein [Candidatus Tisiphia sp.]